ncbi:hypothetical protein AA0521_1617 [Komagataeibacter intermedius NRIC 0521]|uniref:Transposase n=1 Tax=Komagataeibacter intermedius NRIC 0521 TaxID=1307934 RepID=A0ABQ0PI27_9PROT|nr:hypothetical protein AA0521_1617 [Komagataeibacter intermedius NRIC 0521]
MKPAGLIRRAALANPRSKILCGIAFKANRKDAFWLGTKAGLEKVGGLLGEKFGLASASASGNAHAMCSFSQSIPSSWFKVIDTLRSPILRCDWHHTSSGLGNKTSRT